MDIVPELPELTEVKASWIEDETLQGSFLQTEITIKDNPEERNYYRVIIKKEHKWDYSSPEPMWQRVEVFTDREIVFNNITGNIELGAPDFGYDIFSDDLFQGKTYSLNLYFQDDKFDHQNDRDSNHRHRIKVEIHALSENLYKYLRSLETAMNSDNFSEHIKIFTNIKNGYGVLGTFSSSEKIIEIK